MLEIVVHKVKLDPDVDGLDFAWIGFLLFDGLKISKLDRFFKTKKDAIAHYETIQSTIPVTP
jgi:hypothetical protein